MMKLTSIREESRRVRRYHRTVSLRGMRHDGLVDVEDQLVLMLRRVVMGLLLVLLLGMMLLVVMGQMVVLPFRRHAHRRHEPPVCELACFEACCLMRLDEGLIGTLFSHVFHGPRWLMHYR